MNTQFEAIADGLADAGYSIVDHFLSDAETAQIVTLPEFDVNSTAFKKAGIGDRNRQQVNEAIRGDHILWLEENLAAGPLRHYLQRLHDLRQFLNRALFLSLQDIEVHMTIYPPGTHYARHRDQFKRDDRRKLSVICYLNADWAENHGGQLRMYPETHPVDVHPIAGRLVCFRSDQIEHEVLPASRHRRSLTGWMLDRLIV